MEINLVDLDTVDSTSAYAKRHYPSFDPNKITCISAEEQTEGRGRYQRKWISPKGVNLYATFYFQLDPHVQDVVSLAQLMALSLASVLLNEGLHPKIKWPNDIQLNGKKISGVLCETIFEKNFTAIFLGVGININMEQEALVQIDQPATSLKEETKKNWNKKEILGKLAIEFLKDLALFKAQGFEPFRNELEELLL